MLTHALTLKPDVSQDAEQKQNQMNLHEAEEERGTFTRKGVRSVGSKLIECRVFRK